jgi:hypothetical protein
MNPKTQTPTNGVVFIGNSHDHFPHPFVNSPLDCVGRTTVDQGNPRSHSQHRLVCLGERIKFT